MILGKNLDLTTNIKLQLQRSGLQAFHIYFCTRPPQLTLLYNVNIEKFSFIFCLFKI